MKCNQVLLIAATLFVAPAFADDDVEAGPDMRPYVYIDAKAIENKTDNPAANFKGLIDRLDNGLTESGIYRVINSNGISEGVKDDDTFSVVADGGGKE